MVFVAETSTIVVKTQPARGIVCKRSRAHQRAWQAAAVGTIPATFVEGGAPDTRLTSGIACPHCPAGVALRPHAALSLLGIHDWIQKVQTRYGVEYIVKT